MTQYVARVQLHEDATPAAYDELHFKMELAGFSRVIVGKDLKRYKLPTGMYDGYSSLKASVVRDQIFQIAFSVTDRGASLPDVIVFNGSGCSFILDPADLPAELPAEL